MHESGQAVAASLCPSEAVVDDVGEFGQGERLDLDDVGLCVERLRLLGEHRRHRRGFRSGEQHTDLLDVVLQLGAQQPRRTGDAVDAGELVEDQQRRLLGCCFDQKLEQQVERRVGIGPLRRWPRELQLQHAEVDRAADRQRGEP